MTLPRSFSQLIWLTTLQTFICIICGCYAARNTRPNWPHSDTPFINGVFMLAFAAHTYYPHSSSIAKSCPIYSCVHPSVYYTLVNGESDEAISDMPSGHGNRYGGPEIGICWLVLTEMWFCMILISLARVMQWVRSVCYNCSHRPSVSSRSRLHQSHSLSQISIFLNIFYYPFILARRCIRFCPQTSACCGS